MEKFKAEIELEKYVRGQIYDALQGPIIERVISQISSSSSDAYWRSMMEGHSFKVEKKLMSSLYDLFNDVKNSLGFEEPVDFYVTGDSSVNAFSVASTKEGEPNIVNINSALIELMTEEELRFVVGHEIGHLINKDTNFRRLISFVFPTREKAPIVLAYKVHLDDNLCELVADRYGYMAMPNIKTCVSAFFKMSSGLDVTKLDVDMNSFIEENKNRLDYFLKGDGMSSSDHPVNPIRVQALNLFATCKTQEELDKEMDTLISILLKMGNSPVDQHLPYFIATAGLIVAYADEEFSREEYLQLLDNISNYHMFPKDFLAHVMDQDVNNIFIQSVQKILEIEPGLRDAMFNYVLEIAMADNKFNEKEVEIAYKIGSEVFGYSEKEIAGMFAVLIQNIFTPDLEALC